MAGGIKIRQYMREVVENHRDETGEINATTLAEDACQHFDEYGPSPEYEIPEKYFVFAYEAHEADARRRCGTIGSAVGGIISAYDSSHF